MKRFAVLALCALSLAFNACEKHPASALDGVIHTHGAPHETEAKHAPEKAHGAAHKVRTPDAPPPGNADPSKPAGHATPGEAPKFFPEKK